MLQKHDTYQTNGGGIKTVDAHSLLHLKVSKAAAAVDAADWVDGRITVQNPTIRLAAYAWNVSIWSVLRALPLMPEQRDAVRHGQRPLVIPKRKLAPNPLVGPAIKPVINPVMDPRQLLDQVVAQIGINATLNWLGAYEGRQLAA